MCVMTTTGQQPPSLRLLHPQTAALRQGSVGSGSSSSPHSSSTFSSPEVLTPIHQSRANSLVEAGLIASIESPADFHAQRRLQLSCLNQDYQQYVNKLYGVSGMMGVPAPSEYLSVP